MDEKNAYIQKMEARLEQVGATLKKQEAKAKEKIADSRIDTEQWGAQAKETLTNDASRLLQQARDNLDEMRKATGEGYEDAKRRFESAWNELTQSYPATDSTRADS
jgi:F0F1-type ATP synthase membrane subunit b/b'